MAASPDATSKTATIALIGGRGHTGAELLRLLGVHEGVTVALASSRELAGERIADHVDGFEGNLRFELAEPQEVARAGFDVVILALPNGASAPFVNAIDANSSNSIIIDLSADHRFDDRKHWAYGLPEHFRDSLRGAKRIANPGCYATGMQLALRPVLDLLDGPPHVFGISGYSGAGTTPSDRNDPEKLRDNLMPYSLVGHVHEREASRHLGQDVRFLPHVAPFFRGITLTIPMTMKEATSVDALRERYAAAYRDERLVDLCEGIPLVRDIANRHECNIGGLAVDPQNPRRAVVIATLDNLLKGAATQAVQNLNLALGLNELSGIESALPS